MNTYQIIESLNRMSGDQMKSMADADLRKFRDLCYHWHKMADSEVQWRNAFTAAKVA